MGLIQGIINNQVFGGSNKPITADGKGVPTDGNSRQILRKKLDGTEWYDKFPIVEVSDNYNVSLDDYIVLCNFATEKTITLPTDVENKVFIIKCIGDGNVKFVTQLDGILDFKLCKGGAVTVISKSTDYFIIASCGYGI